MSYLSREDMGILRCYVEELMDHVEHCIPCSVRILGILTYLDRPHETDMEPIEPLAKLLNSMYKSTESPEREHPR